VKGFDAWQLGWVIPGEIASLPIAFGAAAQLSAARVARIVTFTQDDQRWFIYEHRPEQLYISTNLAVRLAPGFSFGAGFTHLTSTRGLLRITGTATQRVAGQDEYDSRLEHEVIAELASVRSPNLGAHLALNPWLALALVYRGEGSLELDFESQLDGDLSYGDVAVPTHLLLRSRTTHSFVPQQLTLGSSWRAQERLTFNLDATWVDWSRMPSPVTATRSELTFEADGLLPPALPPETLPRSASLSDRINLRVGAELELPSGWGPDWCVRLGYAFMPTGIDEDSAENLMDADAHVLSAGAGTAFGALGETEDPSVSLDLFVQHGQLSPARFVGRAAEGHWWSFGANLGLAL
jgi:long-subunit fatty acid transport protein